MNRIFSQVGLSLIISFPMSICADAQFSTILNIPPSPNLGDRETIVTGTQVNIGEGGSAGDSLILWADSEVNLTGGSIGNGLFGFSRSKFNYSGGSIGLDIVHQGEATILGGEFELDGVPTTTVPNVPSSTGGILTGITTDGTAFVFFQQRTETDSSSSNFFGDFILSERTTLITTSIPTLDPNPITVPNDPIPRGLRRTQTLNVEPGGSLPKFFTSIGGTLNVSGGTVGEALEIANTNVNITSGEIGARMQIHRNSDVNISGGNIGDGLAAFNGSDVTFDEGELGAQSAVHGGGVFSINGGTIGSEFRAYGGSTVSITGGTIGDGFETYPDSTVTISGGTFGDGFRSARITHPTQVARLDVLGGTIGDDLLAFPSSEIRFMGGSLGAGARISGSFHLSGGALGPEIVVNSGTDFNVIGGEFMLDGAPVNSLSYLPLGSLLSGVLTDGSVFIFNSDKIYSTRATSYSDRIGSMSLTQASIPTAGPSELTVPTDPAPKGLRAGQSLILENGGNLGPGFAAVDSSISVEGGGIGDYFKVAGTQVTINSGMVGSNFYIYRGSEVIINGGEIGERMVANENAKVVITGGTIGDWFVAARGSEVEVRGGDFGNLLAEENSELTINGGFLGTNLLLREGSVLNLENGGLGSGFAAPLGSTVNVFGGSIGDGVSIELGSAATIGGGTVGENFSLDGVANIGGGIFGDGFSSNSGSDVTFFVETVFLDGVDLTSSLSSLPEQELLIEDRDVELSGVLGDGTPYSFLLNSAAGNGDFFSVDARVKVRLGELKMARPNIPEPTSFTLTLLAILHIGSRSCRK